MVRAFRIKIVSHLQFPESFFRINILGQGSNIVVVDRSHLKEYYDASEGRLSFVSELIQGGAFNYGFVCDVNNHYHIDIIRNQLTQNIAAYMPAILDELDAALADELDHIVTKGKKCRSFWLKIDYTPIILYQRIVKSFARIGNRIFVGLPTCFTRPYQCSYCRPESRISGMYHQTLYCSVKAWKDPPIFSENI
jgi:hypothetical protein